MQAYARTAYLFQCNGGELFAVSLDKAGANIPRSSCTEGWLLRQEFQLDSQDPILAPIEVDPIIRSINDKGYYIWRDPCWAQRTTRWLAETTPPPVPIANPVRLVSDGKTDNAVVQCGTFAD
jgi:hypothetical protein